MPGQVGTYLSCPGASTALNKYYYERFKGFNQDRASLSWVWCQTEMWNHVCSSKHASSKEKLKNWEKGSVLPCWHRVKWGTEWLDGLWDGTWGSCRVWTWIQIRGYLAALQAFWSAQITAAPSLTSVFRAPLKEEVGKNLHDESEEEAEGKGSHLL